MPPQLDILLPLPLTDRGPGYTCGMIARGMACAELDVTIVTPRTRRMSVAPAHIVQALPQWARYVPYRWVRPGVGEHLEDAFLSQAGTTNSEQHGAYIWPDASLDAILRLKRDRITIFREMINCHRGTAKAILDQAYRRIGIPPRHTITEASVISEQNALNSSDYIFCANQMVEDSLLEHGLPHAKIISASYGWDPAQFSGAKKLLSPSDGMTLVFAGTISVRKGCHLLLDYWARSKVKGRLVLAGEIEDTIKDNFARLLGRDDVVVLDYVDDIASLYRSADIFVFPTLEEGGPQVTYEACGCALPVITTPMGAGRIVRHGLEGFVLDPYDADGWIDAIRNLAEDHQQRRAFSLSAKARAKVFEWNSVAHRRRRQILERIDDRHAATLRLPADQVSQEAL